MKSFRSTNYSSTDNLGEGSFGSVRTVYDDNGDTFAMKIFDADDEILNEEEIAEDVSVSPRFAMCCALTTLREVSILRMFSRILVEDTYVQHPSVMRIHDLCWKSDSLCMIMPKASCTLSSAIKGSILTNQQKLLIGYRLLHAVAFLHANDIIHRDIKCDNVLLDENMCPILADFSLAKLFDGNDTDAESHTPSPGTSTYKAPEVCRKDAYGLPADVFSVGVCLLELFNGLQNFTRDKAALNMYEEVRNKMSKQKPLPQLLCGLLDPDPKSRITAKAALESAVFASLHAAQASKLPVLSRTINKIVSSPKSQSKSQSKSKSKHNLKGTKDAADLETKETKDAQTKETQEIKRKKTKEKLEEKKEEKDEASDFIQRIAKMLEYSNPLSVAAAHIYFKNSNASLVNCVVLAGRLYEIELMSLGYVQDIIDEKLGMDIFDPETYTEDEKLIFQSMNYCLYI